jgi:hypothetical protein
MRTCANIWHLIGRLNQPAADWYLPLRVFKPSSSDSADRGRSIIWVTLRAFKPASSDSADRGRSIIRVHSYPKFVQIFTCAVRATKIHFYVTFAEIQVALKRKKLTVFQKKKMRIKHVLWLYIYQTF